MGMYLNQSLYYHSFAVEVIRRVGELAQADRLRRFALLRNCRPWRSAGAESGAEQNRDHPLYCSCPSCLLLINGISLAKRRSTTRAGPSPIGLEHCKSQWPSVEWFRRGDLVCSCARRSRASPVTRLL